MFDLWIDANLIFDREGGSEVRLADIFAALARDGIYVAETRRRDEMTIAKLLQARGAEKKRTRDGTIWNGVQIRRGS